ncbi:MAG TPA: hypothetical protein VGC16_09465 [Rhizomicrobium sp.]
MAEPDPDDRGRSNIGGAVAVIVLVALVIWLAHALYQNLKLQKCEMEGRRDCVDVPQPSQ